MSVITTGVVYRPVRSTGAPALTPEVVSGAVAATVAVTTAGRRVVGVQELDLQHKEVTQLVSMVAILVRGLLQETLAAASVVWMLPTASALAASCSATDAALQKAAAGAGWPGSAVRDTAAKCWGSRVGSRKQECAPRGRRAAGDVGAEAGHIGALQHQSCAEGHLVHVQLVDLRTAAFRQRETKEATWRAPRGCLCGRLGTHVMSSNSPGSGSGRRPRCSARWRVWRRSARTCPRFRCWSSAAGSHSHGCQSTAFNHIAQAQPVCTSLASACCICTCAREHVRRLSVAIHGT